MKGGSIKLLVADASWWLAYLLPHEITKPKLKEMDALVSRPEMKFLAPRLLVYEVGNALKMNVQRKRIDQETGKLFLNNFLKLKIEISEIDYREVLKTAIENNMTFYDAAYVQLAWESKADLLTLDEKMKQVYEKLKLND